MGKFFGVEEVDSFINENKAVLCGCQNYLLVVLGQNNTLFVAADFNTAAISVVLMLFYEFN